MCISRIKYIALYYTKISYLYQTHCCTMTEWMLRVLEIQITSIWMKPFQYCRCVMGLVVKIWVVFSAPVEASCCIAFPPKERNLRNWYETLRSATFLLYYFITITSLAKNTLQCPLFEQNMSDCHRAIKRKFSHKNDPKDERKTQVKL